MFSSPTKASFNRIQYRTKQPQRKKKKRNAKTLKLVLLVRCQLGSTRFLYNWATDKSGDWIMENVTLFSSLLPTFPFKRNCYRYHTYNQTFYLLLASSHAYKHTHTHTIFLNEPKSYFIIIYSLLSSLLLLFLFDCVLLLLLLLLFWTCMYSFYRC